MFKKGFVPMIRVLHIIGSLNRGGAETFLMNLYRSMDRSKIQFDFAIYDRPKGESFYNEVIKMGGRVFFLPSKSEGLLKNINKIKNVVRENNYYIVWRHSDSCIGGIDLIGARLGGSNRNILHSHSTSTGKFETYLHWILRPIINAMITDRFACGNLAGNWMYEKRDTQIIKNGINLKKFSFDLRIRNIYRLQFRVENKLIIGHVGRFDEGKNQTFLIRVFQEIKELYKDTELILIGSGEKVEEIKYLVKDMGLDDSVKFLGNRSDVSSLLQMIDVFVMPSLYEGLPVTLIEAQAAGLPCVVSDRITQEVNLTGKMDYLSLELPAQVWAKKIIERGQQENDRDKDAKKVKEAGYDIKEVAEVVQNLLLV